MKLFHVGLDLFFVFMEVKANAGLAVYLDKLPGNVALVARPSPLAHRGTDSCGDPVDLE